MKPSFAAVPVVSRPPATDPASRKPAMSGGAAVDAFDTLLTAAAHPRAGPGSSGDPSSGSPTRTGPDGNRRSQRTQAKRGDEADYLSGAAGLGLPFQCLQLHSALFAGSPPPSETGDSKTIQGEIPGPEGVNPDIAKEVVPSDGGDDDPPVQPLDDLQSGVAVPDGECVETKISLTPVSVRMPDVDLAALEAGDSEEQGEEGAMVWVEGGESGNAEATEVLSRVPSAGTSAADISIQMKGAATTFGSTLLEGQELPDEVCAGKSAATPRGSSREDGGSDDIDFDAPRVGPMESPGARHEILVRVTPAEAANSLSGVDRTSRISALIEGSVVRFHKAGSESYEVSIRPDSGTEILLKISLKSGVPEVEAELRKGDAAVFASAWQDLHKRLADQGIRLAPTADAGSSMTGSHRDSGFGSGQQQSPERAPFRPGPLNAAAVRHDSLPRSQPKRLSPGRGWETWA